MASRILVPLDGSVEAEQAIPVAAQLARRNAGTVVLSLIAPTSSRTPDDGAQGRPIAVTDGAGMGVYARARQMDEYLAHAAAHRSLCGVRTETNGYLGPRLATILAACRAAEADAMVIYDRETPELGGHLLGSLAHQVSLTADVPVLAVRRGQALHGALGAFRLRPLRAVVGMDGSPYTEALLPEIARIVGALAAPGLGALHLVHVAGSEQAAADARAYLSAVASDLRREMINEHALLLTWSVVVDDDPAAALGELTSRPRGDAGITSSIEAMYGPERTGEIPADEFDGADLLVVADRPLHHLRRGRSSDTLERVLWQGASPVLVARSRFVRSRGAARLTPAREDVATRSRAV